MVALKLMNYNTRFCIFSIDSFEDLSSLPTQQNAGKKYLSTIGSCCSGSIAQSTDGNNYILHGDTNQWIPYHPMSGGTIIPNDITAISDSYIQNLFK